MGTLETKLIDFYPEPVRISVLPSGVSVISISRPKSDVFTLKIIVLGGNRSDDISGAHHLLEHMLASDPDTGGTRAKLLELRKIGLHDECAVTSNLFTEYAGTTRASSAQRLLDAQLEAITRPHWSAQALERERKAIRVEMSRKAQELDHERTCIRHLYPDCWILENQPGGFDHTLASMSMEDLERHYRRSYTAQRIAVFASGPIPHETLCFWVEGWAQALPRSAEPKPPRATFRTKPARARATVRHPYIDNPGIDFTFPTRPFGPEHVPQSVLYSCLTDHDGRLTHELRHTRGLIYGLRGGSGGPFDMFGYFATVGLDADHIEETISATRETLDGLDEDAIASQLELMKADHALHLERRREKPVVKLADLVEYWYMDELETDRNARTAEAIENLTSEELLALARENFKDENLGWLIRLPMTGPA